MREGERFGYYPRMPRSRIAPNVEVVLPANQAELYRTIASEANKYPAALAKDLGLSRIQVLAYLSEENQIDGGKQVKVRIVPPGAAMMLRVITGRLEAAKEEDRGRLLPIVTKAYLNS